ncbi:MAG TPA: hypothetical protein PKN48_00545 [Bacteroidales bacterium]|nr:hypothetical protein [Bacteroidales bacterium]
MNVSDTRLIINDGDLIQIIANFATGIGQVREIIGETLIVDPPAIIDKTLQEQYIPATMIIPISNIEVIFIIKPVTKNESITSKVPETTKRRKTS